MKTFSAIATAAVLVLAAHGAFADDAKRPESKMAKIPAGTFTMGRDKGRSKPHSETVAAFELDVNLVTVSEYAACVEAKACKTTICNQRTSGKEKHPVNCVHYDQAVAYCTWVGKRLPTEKEWEYAARGGSKSTIYSWGDDPPAKQLCWQRGKEETCEVGSFPAGAFGLFDMNGNCVSPTSTMQGYYNVYKGGRYDATDAAQVQSSMTNLIRRAPDGGGSRIMGIRCAK